MKGEKIVEPDVPQQRPRLTVGNDSAATLRPVQRLCGGVTAAPTPARAGRGAVARTTCTPADQPHLSRPSPGRAFRGAPFLLLLNEHRRQRRGPTQHSTRHPDRRVARSRVTTATLTTDTRGTPPSTTDGARDGKPKATWAKDPAAAARGFGAHRPAYGLPAPLMHAHAKAAAAALLNSH